MKTSCCFGHFLRAGLFLLIGILMLGACSNSSPEEHSFREVLTDGIMVAENRGGPRFDGELFRYEPVVTLRQDEEEPGSLIYPSSSFIRTVRWPVLSE